MSRRSDVGRYGEHLAIWFLEDKGLTVLASNVRIGAGEVDIIAMDRGERVAVEVRTRIGGDDPIDAVDPEKRERVARLARHLGASRTDIIGIRLGSDGVDIHWVPAA